MPSLIRLDLGWCGMDDVGSVALVSALEQNTSLQILDLKYNNVADRGFMRLAESLPNIRGLQQINTNQYHSGCGFSIDHPAVVAGRLSKQH
jgi:Ran GTPase-activating protein (RanGAP) involved in mRNA processing and transport